MNEFNTDEHRRQQFVGVANDLLALVAEAAGLFLAAKSANDTGMKRSTPKGISQLSRKPADKLMACLCHNTTVGSPAYLQSPDYFNACARWHVDLTAEQKEIVLTAVNEFTHQHVAAAEKIAERLPSAPKPPA